MDRVGSTRLMCPLPHSIPSSGPGRKLSTTDRVVRDFILELQAHTEAFGTNGSSLIVDSESLEGSCRLPLSLSQSRLLASLVTTFVPHSTWWSMKEDKDSWALCGRVGEVSGPQVTVFITATSDRRLR